MKITSAQMAEMTKKLVDEGKIIEAGWVSLRFLAVPENAPPVQVEEMRNAFFAGAKHLFSSILTVLDPGEEPSEADMSRMDKIHEELEAFITDYEKRRLPTMGRA